MSPVTASFTFLRPVKAQERTYRLLADDGLETVVGAAVQGLVDALDLQSDLGSKIVMRLLLSDTSKITTQTTAFGSFRCISKPQRFSTILPK